MRTMLCLVVATSVAFLAVPGMAQQGHLALYADPLGTQSRIDAHPGMPIDVYLVMFTEDLVKAVAFNVVTPPGVFMFPKSFGPNGHGLNAPTPGGYNVGLGECVSGGGGAPILVATFTMVCIEPAMPREIHCLPNRDINVSAPVYVRCLTNEFVVSSIGPKADFITDHRPPTIKVDLSRYALWPNNYKIVDIDAFVDVEDDLDPAPNWVLTSVACNEGTDGIYHADCGTMDTCLQLCSTWSGCAEGRVYWIIYTAEDASGNVAEHRLDIEVPVAETGTFVAGPGLTPAGGIEPGVQTFTLIIPSTKKDGKPLPFTPTIDPEELTGGPSPRYDFNAAALPVERIGIGNTAGLVKPLQHTIQDTDHDGTLDLMLVFPADPVQSLFSKCDDGPLGLYYETFDGVDYLVEDLFGVVANGADVAVGEGRQPGPIDRTQLVRITPNPFNPSTKAIFAVSHEQLVRIEVFNLRGQLIRTLENRLFPAGLHQIPWDGLDERGGSVASGVYVFSMRSEDVNQSRKALLLK